MKFSEVNLFRRIEPVTPQFKRSCKSKVSVSVLDVERLYKSHRVPTVGAQLVKSQIFSIRQKYIRQYGTFSLFYWLL